MRGMCFWSGSLKKNNIVLSCLLVFSFSRNKSWKNWELSAVVWFFIMNSFKNISFDSRFHLFEVFAWSSAAKNQPPRPRPPSSSRIEALSARFCRGFPAEDSRLPWFESIFSVEEKPSFGGEVHFFRLQGRQSHRESTAIQTQRLPSRRGTSLCFISATLRKLFLRLAFCLVFKCQFMKMRPLRCIWVGGGGGAGRGEGGLTLKH